MKYILVTECQLLSSGNLIQEVFLCVCVCLKKNSLNVNCELVMDIGGFRQKDCQMYEWMAYVKIINRVVTTHGGQ